MKYAWNRSRSVDPQTFGETVEQLSEENGGVCPSWALVDEARPLESPIHPMFEWDDLVAAEAYRREQGRHHLRELRIIRDVDGEPHYVRALVHVVRDDGGEIAEGYRLTSLIVKDAGEYRQVLDEALAGLRSWRERYRHLSELSEVFDVIESVV